MFYNIYIYISVTINIVDFPGQPLPCHITIRFVYPFTRHHLLHYFYLPEDHTMSSENHEILSVKSLLLSYQLPVFLVITEPKLLSEETGSSLLKVMLTFFSPHYSPHVLNLYWLLSMSLAISIILLLPATSKYTIGLKSFFMTLASMKKIQTTPWCLCSSHLITLEDLFLHLSLVFPRHNQT